MRHQTTINELAQIQGLFSVVDHITVEQHDSSTDTTEEVTLPPPLIRRTQRRDDTTVWILTPPGIHERIFVDDEAPVTVYFKDVDPHRFTGHVPPQTPVQQPPVQQPPATWQPQPAPAQPHPTYPPQHPPAQQPAAPQRPTRPAAPWTAQQQPPN
ncbi:hypothetical protein [Streptomyces lydicus]|uniref:hypothetical protein n=1 Tax=Streptomyces lydicus TaxID=47763 RepID=UPI001011904B|nr:hypothetical protein [Streptomyces lydicus]